jgi:hypothetical protein
MTNTDPSDTEPLELNVYELYPDHGLRWAPATPARDWMAKIGQRIARRCLPMPSDMLAELGFDVSSAAPDT